MDMFALLETEYTADRRAPRFTVGIRRAGGCKVAVVRVRSGHGLRAVRRYWRDLDAALSEIHKLGIRTAVTADGFMGAERLAGYGLSPPDRREVFLRCVPRLIAEHAEGRQGKTLRAAVLTEHVGVMARKAAYALLPYASSLCVTGRGAAEFCDRLRVRYGVAAQCSAAALKGTELAVCFKLWDRDFKTLPETTLILAGGCADQPYCRVIDGVTPPARRDAPPPGGVDAELWNAALFLER